MTSLGQMIRRYQSSTLLDILCVLIKNSQISLDDAIRILQDDSNNVHMIQLLETFLTGNSMYNVFNFSKIDEIYSNMPYCV